MKQINRKLQDYIKKQIFPIYEKNEPAHNLEHIMYAIRRSINLASQFPNIDINMVYTIAAYHDLAHHIDKDNHEILSAQIFYEDEKMKEFFNDEQRKIIKEAIEDHRGSLEYEPRSDYGKIISSADRTTNIELFLTRTHSYTLAHFPKFNLSQAIDRAYDRIIKKYSKDGYAKHYCYDKEYEQFKQDVEAFSEDKLAFAKKYLEVNNITDSQSIELIHTTYGHTGQVRKRIK